MSYSVYRGSPYDGFRNPPGDIIAGLYQWLLAKPDLMMLLGNNPGAIPDDPMMFEHVLEFTVQGEQTNALVLKYMGGWGAPNPASTAKFPRIGLEFYCDPIRDEDNMESMEYDTIRRLVYIYEQFDKYMHRPAALTDIGLPDPLRTDNTKIEWWGDVRTIDCVRLGELTYFNGGDGLYIGNVYYGVTVL
jgi:hypothetical protein